MKCPTSKNILHLIDLIDTVLATTGLSILYKKNHNIFVL
jgi:hypothetical protein